MRKVLIVVIGLASFGALVGVQQASAGQTCKTVCDQSEMHNGKMRCFSAHQVCTKTQPPASGTAKSIKNKKMK